MKTWTILLCVFVSFSLRLVDSSCNEAVCASIVSKCMLTQSCKCDVKNCTCCKDCYNCLDDLYYQCCSCVEICPDSNDTNVPLSENSHIGDLADGVPDLFNAMMEEEDKLQRWIIYHYPIDQDLKFFSAKNKEEFKIIAVSVDRDNDLGQSELNCTVSFMTQCMPWNKCKKSCSSLGASRYRWFHDGCCECIGHTCLNYGISVNKCLKCPPETDDDIDDLDGYDDEMSEVESNDTGEGTDEALENKAVVEDERKKSEPKENYRKSTND